MANPNIPEKNPISTLFGLAQDGTSWLMDVIVTTIIVTAFMIFMDWLIADEIQNSMPILTNAVIIVPASILGVYIWRRASADNARRKVTK